MSYKRFKYFTITRKRKIRYFYSNKGSQITLIFFHGFMSDMVGAKPMAVQRFCKKQKLNFLKFEYSGHGKSTGKFIQGNISKWTNDAKQLIKSKIKKDNNLFFIGSSMGSWIALNLFTSFKNQIKGFVGISSAPEFLERLMWKKFNKKIKKTILKEKIYNLEHGDYVYPMTKQLIFDGRKNKVLNRKIKLKIPVSMFHGFKDDVVPVSFSKKMLKIFPKAHKKLIIIKGGEHSLSKKHNLKKICNELDQMIINFS